MVLTITHFQLPFPLLCSLLTLSLPQTHSYAGRTRKLLREKDLAVCADEGSWPAGRSWAWATLCSVFLAGVSPRESSSFCSWHFVNQVTPENQRGSTAFCFCGWWGDQMERSGHSKQKCQGSNMELFCCLSKECDSEHKHEIVIEN